MKRLRRTLFTTGLIALLFVFGGVALAQSNTAGIATFPGHYVPSLVGAGVAIDCGGDYPGLRGQYLCSISQTGNEITVTFQTVDNTADSGVATDTLVFNLAGRAADGVVTGGTINAAGTELNLTVTTGGVDSTVSITIPAALRNTGDITGVAAGTGLTGGGTSGDVTLNIDNPFTQAEETKLTGIEDNATADQSAAEVLTDTSGFNGILASTTTNVQLALDTIDNQNTVHMESGQTAYTGNGAIAITTVGAPVTGDLILFDAPNNLGSSSTQNLTLNINGTGARNLVDREENQITEAHLEQDAWYVVFRDSATYLVLTDLTDALSQGDVQALINASAVPNFQTGTAFPAGPDGSDLFLFNADTTGLSDSVDYDGSTPITTAARGDVFKYDSANTQWVKQAQAGTPATWAQATGATGTVPTARLGTGTANATTFLRGDNTWQAVGTGGGVTTFTALTDTPATITADECVMGNTAGDALEFGACGTGGGASLSDATPANIAGTGAAGTGTDASRHDHVHGGAPQPGSGVVNTTYTGTGSVGTGTAYARANHRHGLDKTSRFDDGEAPQNVTTGSSATGDDTVPARRDHVHGGDTNTQRTLATAAPPNVVTGTGSVGTSSNVARQDHTHGGDRDTNTQRTLSSATPANIAVSGAAGSATAVSRDDHVHGGQLEAGSSVASLTFDTTGTVGTGTAYARDNHRHGIVLTNLFDNVDPVAVGTAAAEGSQVNAARRDHAHALSSTLTARLLPTSPTDDQIARYDSATSAWVAEDFTGGGTTVTANPSVVATATLGAVTISGTTYNPGPVRIFTTGITYSGTDNREITIAASGWDPDTGDMIVFQHNTGTDANYSSDETVLLSVGDESDIRTRISDAGSLRDVRLEDLVRYEWLSFVRAGTFWHLQWRTYQTGTGDITGVTAGTGLSGGGDSGDVTLNIDNPFEASDETKLDGIASGAEVNVQSDWNATAGDALILNKPTLVSSFTGLSDTPSSYTSQARQFLRVNTGETALEFVAEPVSTNSIPHVGRIPTVTDTSPVLVFLTHDEFGGDRDDAVVQIAEAPGGAFCGYSNGDVYPPFGSINEASPIATVLGVWDDTANTCNLANIYSINEGFIDLYTQVVFTVSGTETTCNLGTRYQEYGYQTKRILSCTAVSALPTGDISMNLLDADSNAYWTDGTLTFRAGLYEKVGTPPMYHDLAPAEEAHKTGEGSAACGEAEPPTAPGQLCVTSDGRGYFAMPRTSLITTPASITVAGNAGAQYVGGLYETDDLENRNNLADGEFIWLRTTQEFYQYQDPDFEVVTWTEAWQYVVDNVEDDSTTQGFLASVFLGEFASESEVIRDRDGYSNDSPTYYFLYFDFGTLIEITAFTHSARETITEGLAWRGPVIIPEEVLDVVSANPSGTIDEPLDSILIGSQRYSVIVRPGANGQLRNPVASDYDGTYARSRVLAVVDGQSYKVRRTLVPGHSAEGTFTEYTSGSTIDINGTTHRFRGNHYYDGGVSNPQEHDFYYNVHDHVLRVRASDGFLGDFWQSVSEGSPFDSGFRLVGYFPSAAEALSHATSNGQRFVYGSGVGRMYTLSGFSAATADQYTYSWTPSTLPAVLPANDILVDDETYTWNGDNQPSQEVHFSRALTEGDDGRPIIIDWRSWAASGSDPGGRYRDAGTMILSEHVRIMTEQRPLQLAKTLGGDSPIDHNENINEGHIRSAVTFKFPQHDDGHALEDMRMFYIGDHVDDVDGQFGSTATTITLNSVNGIKVDTDYWMIGAVTNTGLGCTTSYHSEKVTVTAIGTPNPLDITVTRGVDSTGLPDTICAFASGADFIEDNKTTFVLVAGHNDQEAAVMSFTLLAQGVGAGSTGGSSPDVTVGGGIVKQKHLVSSGTETTINSATWTTIMSQEVTVVDADRVYIDAVFSIESTANNGQCEMRAARGTTVVGSAIEADIGFNGEIENKSMRVVETPGAGTYTYDLQVQDNGAGNCIVNAVGTTSFATIEVLGANP